MSKNFKFFSSDKEERCAKHPKQVLTMGCDTCMSPEGVSEPVCVECAVTGHRGHSLCNLEEIIERKKQSVGVKITRGEAVATRIEGLLRDIKENESVSITLANTDCSTIKGKAEEIKEDVDRIVSEFEKQRKSTEKKYALSMNNTKDSLTAYSHKLNAGVQKCKTANGRIPKLSKLVEAEQDIDRTLKMFSSPKLTKPIRLFIPSKRNSDHIRRYLGTFVGDEPVKPNTVAEQPKDDIKLEKQEFQSAQVATRSVISEVYAFKHAYESIRTVSIEAANKAWICRETLVSVFTDIKLVNSEGDVDETLFFSTNSGVTDVSVFEENSTVASCKDKTIRQITPDKKDHSILFTTDFEPSSLCQIAVDKFVVCFYDDGEIVLFNSQGQKLKFLARGATAVDVGDGYTEGTVSYTPIITYPYKVRWNSNTSGNGCLAVCNHSPHCVVIMDTDLNVKSCYHGVRPCDLGTGESEAPHFEPMDVCFDELGNILIADGPRSSIIMLDTKGTFLREVRKTRVNPTALAVETGQLWIGFCTGKIEVVKYGGKGSVDDWETIEERFAKLNTLYHPK